MINIWYIDKTAQKNADDYLSFYPTAINLSILDFKYENYYLPAETCTTINLSILDFKLEIWVLIQMFSAAINLSILDFKFTSLADYDVIIGYKSIHIGF